MIDEYVEKHRVSYYAVSFSGFVQNISLESSIYVPVNDLVI